MKKLCAGCLSLWMGTAVLGFAQEPAAASDVDAMALILQRLDAIEKRLDGLKMFVT